MSAKSEVIKIAKWEFSTIFLPKNTDFDNHLYVTVPFKKLGSPVEKFYHPLEQKTNKQKNPRDNTLKRVK